MGLVLTMLSPLLALLKPVGLIFWRMLLSMLTQSVLKELVISTLENLVAKFEKKTKETPDNKDDEDAKMFRSWLEQAKKAWEKTDVNNS